MEMSTTMPAARTGRPRDRRWRRALAFAGAAAAAVTATVAMASPAQACPDHPAMHRGQHLEVVAE